MEPCDCQSGLDYEQCCGPVLSGEHPAATAEALMRSRYTAFSRCEIEYLMETIAPNQRDGHDADELRKWAENAQWLGLDILNCTDGGEKDDTGTVEFIARYREKGIRRQHHEVATFQKSEGRWYFVDGQAPEPHTVVRESPKVGRNDPCPCNSGKKFKKCCGR